MKKKIPLVILESLQPTIDNNLNFIKAKEDDGTIMHLIDKDENSDFYYKIIKQDDQKSQNGKPIYQIEYKPKSKDDITSRSIRYSLEGVIMSFQKWLNLLQGYNEIHTIYDDPILKSNQERFEKQFENLDEDADIVSFDLPQQIFLDDYLNTVKSKLVLLQEGKTQEQKIQLEELVNEATEIQNNLTKETKRKVVTRLSKLWAKAQKIGLKVIKEIFVSVAAEVTRKLLTGG